MRFNDLQITAENHGARMSSRYSHTRCRKTIIPTEAVADYSAALEAALI
jgi:hypothetical protein